MSSSDEGVKENLKNIELLFIVEVGDRRGLPHEHLLGKKKMTEQEERYWVVFCHLGGVIFFYFLNLIVPLGIWVYQRENSPYVREQGLEIVNFQLSLSLYALALILVFYTIYTVPIMVDALVVMAIFNFFCVINGAIHADKGKPFRYPFNLRLIKYSHSN